MKNKNIKLILFVLYAVWILSCAQRKSIDNLPHLYINYNQLPDTVKEIYKYEVLNIDTFRRVFKCIKCREESSMEYHSIANAVDLMKKGFSYDFSINNKIYTLKANQGNPFVYYDGYFYYPNELNLNRENYTKIKYKKVFLN